MRLTGTGRAAAAAALSLPLLLSLAAPSPARTPAAPPAAPAAPAEGSDPIDFAIVVDQSDSLSDTDLAREVDAASLLAQGELSERSRAAVIGFGSSEKPGQSPVREACPLTTADTAGRQRLSDCVRELSRRDPARMGPGTDFPAAVRQAVDRLTEKADPAVPKVVFLLTDGRLDVGDSPEYGTDRSSRQANGQKRLADELARARREEVQIWPLGFGSGIDRAALTGMAEGGYRGGCADLPSATPRMRVVADSAGIDKALQETFAAARCASVSDGDRGRPPGDLHVTIPPIATDGTITVSKHDPKVTVTYYDPQGRKVPTQGPFDGSTFELSGQDGPVEALRVKNPLPGRWRAHVEAPEGHRDREVAVRAIWQGRLRSTVTLDPASPRPGEKTVVEVRMQTRRGVVVTDPAQLAGIKVTARLAGDGFAPVDVPLADDGRAPDREAADVRFTGTVTVPAGATGALRLTTLMAAPGVTSDQRPLHARTSSGTPPVTAGLTLDRGTVHPGGSVGGTLAVTNNDSAPHTLRLALADQADGAALRVEPATVTVGPGRRENVRVTLTVGADSPLGDIGGQVAVVDTGDGDRALDTAFVDVRVDAPPTWWETWRIAVLGAAVAVLVVGTVVALRLKARARRRDLTGMVLELRGDGRHLGELTVRAGQTQGGAFHFTADRVRGTTPDIQRATTGAPGAHALRRTGSGELRLRPHRGREQPVRPGEPAGLDDGLELVVHDRAAGRATDRDALRTAPGRPPAADHAAAGGTWRDRVPFARGTGGGSGRDAADGTGRGARPWSRPAADDGGHGGDGRRAAGTGGWDPHF